MKKFLVAAALSVTLLTGCAALKPAAIHPGAANTTDSGFYDSLLVTDSVIQSTKADLAAGKFPVAIAGPVKTALNNLITAYDAADTAYLAYHAAVATGPATAQMNAVTADLQQVTTATNSLTTAKAGN